MKPTNPRGLIFCPELIPGVMAGTVTMFSVPIPQANDHGEPAGAIHPARESGWIAWWPGTEPGLAEFTKREYLHGFPCPFRAGERRYIKEAWAWPGEEFLFYRANPSDRQTMEWAAKKHAENHNYPKLRWCSARTMPKSAARTWIEITAVRPAQCQDITEEEAVASGCRAEPSDGTDLGPGEFTAKLDYAMLWDHWHAKRGFPWSANAWVWRVTFRLAPEGGSPCR